LLSYTNNYIIFRKKKLLFFTICNNRIWRKGNPRAAFSNSFTANL